MTADFHNPSLADVTKKMIIRALSIFERLKRPVCWETKEVPVINSPHGYRLEPQNVLDPRLALSFCKDELLSTEESQEFSEFVGSVEELKEELIDVLPQEPWDEKERLWKFVISQLVYRYFDLQKSLITHKDKTVLDEEAWSALYRDFESYCYSREITLIHSVPIFGVDVGSETITLTPTVCLRPASDEERRTFWSSAAHSHHITQWEVVTLRTILECRFEVLKDNLSIDTRKLVTLSESLLRLLTGTRVAMGFYLETCEPWFNCRDSGVGGLRSWAQTRSYLDFPYSSKQLSEVEIKTLAELWQIAAQLSEQKGFEIGLSRYAATFNRDDPSDQLIDSWIGLEALLGPFQNELSYRACLRTAYFLHPTDATQRRRIFDVLRKSYKARSTVVHGSSSAGAAQETRNILGEVLKHCLETKVTPKADVLDKLVLGAA